MTILSDVLGSSAATTSSSNAGGVVVEVDFGSSFTDYVAVNVSGQTWVDSSTAITVTPYADSEESIEVLMMNFRCVVGDRVAGDGFTLHVFAPNEARGVYYFSCVGGT